MKVEDDVGPVRDLEPVVVDWRHGLPLVPLHLVKELRDVNDDAVAEDSRHAVVDQPGGKQVERVLVTVRNHRVTRVVAALRCHTEDTLRFSYKQQLRFGQKISKCEAIAQPQFSRFLSNSASIY